MAAPRLPAHVDHLRYGFELLNRWTENHDPFVDADYSASWRREPGSHDGRLADAADGARARSARLG